MDLAVDKFGGMAKYQPVINGVGGNLVAVQASRISTSLHMESSLGSLPEGVDTPCSNPVQVFLARGTFLYTNIHSERKGVHLSPLEVTLTWY